MASNEDDPMLGETLSLYQKTLRDRANDSIDVLKQVMAAGAGGRGTTRPQASVSTLQSGGTTSGDPHTGAAQKLKSMLNVSSQHMSTPVSTVRGAAQSAASIDDFLPIIQNLTSYINQLEGENHYLKDQVSSLKITVDSSNRENDKLRDELKERAIESALSRNEDQSPSLHATPAPYSEQRQHEGIIVGQTLGAMVQEQRQLDKETLTKWQLDLEKVKALHDAKTNRLEQQLSYSKDELQRAMSQVESLKSKLRIYETHRLISEKCKDVDAEPGMCLKCAQNDAVISATQTNLNVQKITKLTQERVELLDALKQLKQHSTRLQSREIEAYNQVKKGVELVEQAQLEKTKALLEREQLNDELSRSKRRVEDVVKQNQIKIETERKIVEQHAQTVVDDLNRKIMCQAETNSGLEQDVKKLTRLKMDLMKKLEDANKQIQDQGIQVNKVSDNMKSEMSMAVMERDMARQEVSTLKLSKQQSDRDGQQERARLRAEVDDLRRRLLSAESEVHNSKEEIIHVTETLNAVESEAFHTRKTKDELEKMKRDIVHTAEQRENDLNMLLKQNVTKYTKTIADMEGMLASQHSLIGKYVDECKTVAEQLQLLSIKYKNDMKNLKSTNKDLFVRAERGVTRVKEMEDQCIQHGQLHQRMKTHVKQLGNEAQKSKNQVYNLMVKQNNVLQDRNLLAREVEYFRTQVLHCDDKPQRTTDVPPAKRDFTHWNNITEDVLLNQDKSTEEST